MNKLVLFPPTESAVVDGREDECSNRASVNWALGDCTSLDTPFLRRARSRARTYFEFDMRAGDALYIPPFFWHTVHASMPLDDGDQLVLFLTIAYRINENHRIHRIRKHLESNS